MNWGMVCTICRWIDERGGMIGYDRGGGEIREGRTVYIQCISAQSR